MPEAGAGYGTLNTATSGDLLSLKPGAGRRALALC